MRCGGTIGVVPHVVCALLSVTLSLSGTVPFGVSGAGVIALVGPYDAYEAKLIEAEHAATTGEQAKAVSLYRDAYESLPAQDRAGDLGADVVTRVDELTHSETFQTAPDPTALAGAIQLMERHIEDLRRFAPDRDTARTQVSLATLVALRDAKAEPKAPEPEPEPGPEPPPEPPEPDPQPQPQPASRRPLGVGLVVSGAVAFVGGVSLLAYGGWWFGRTNAGYRREVGDLGPGFSSPALNDWRDEEYVPARVLMATGAIVGVIGVGLVIGGAVVLARDGRSNTVFAPLLGPDRVGIGARGRF
jgi:hypothetical protein